MKKISYSLLSLFVVALLFITGCKDDDAASTEPTITLDGAQGESISVDPGQAVEFNVVVNTPAGFSSLQITKDGGVTEEPVVINGADGETGHQHPFSFSPSIEEAGETIVFTFEATDNEGREVSDTYSVTVNSPTISSYENVVIGGRFNKEVGNFYSMLDNTTYLYEEALDHPERIDFLYYYNEEKQFTITAPSDEYARIVYNASIPLTGMENQTFFARSSADYSAITEPEHIIDAWNNTKEAEPLTVLHFIEIGDVFVFQLDPSRGSRYGIAEVTDLFNDPADPKTRTVTLSIKITMQAQ